MHTTYKECPLEHQHLMRAMIRSIEIIQESISQSAAVCSYALGEPLELSEVSQQTTWNVILGLLHKIKGQCETIELTVLDELQGKLQGNEITFC